MIVVGAILALSFKYQICLGLHRGGGLLLAIAATGRQLSNSWTLKVGFLVGIVWNQQGRPLGTGWCNFLTHPLKLPTQSLLAILCVSIGQRSAFEMLTFDFLCLQISISNWNLFFTEWSRGACEFVKRLDHSACPMSGGSFWMLLPALDCKLIKSTR